ncbi:hypothetical protein QAD02_005494, partial [Eretmocerus hayati]
MNSLIWILLCPLCALATNTPSPSPEPILGLSVESFLQTLMQGWGPRIEALKIRLGRALARILRFRAIGTGPTSANDELDGAGESLYIPEECIPGYSGTQALSGPSPNIVRRVRDMIRLDQYRRDLEEMRCEMNSVWPRLPENINLSSNDELKKMIDTFNELKRTQDSLLSLLNFSREEYAMAEEILDCA